MNDKIKLEDASKRSTKEIFEEVKGRKIKDKVFGIGFPKTGTTTLAAALIELEYTATGGDIEHNARRSYLTLRYDAIINLWSIEKYQSLYIQYPKSKFILTVRDTKSWIDSYKSDFVWMGDLSPKKVVGNLKSFISHYPEESEIESNIAAYEQHNKEVETFFKDKKDRFLKVDICNSNIETWDILCKFLGILDIPDVPFPYYNKSKST